MTRRACVHVQITNSSEPTNNYAHMRFYQIYAKLFTVLCKYSLSKAKFQSWPSNHAVQHAPDAPRVGRTRIAWQLPLLGVLHPSHACQRRS